MLLRQTLRQQNNDRHNRIRRYSHARVPDATFVAAPKAEGRYPGILCFSDIFQLTPPMLRTCVRLAGYGFVAAAPEIYRRNRTARNGDSI